MTQEVKEARNEHRKAIQENKQLFLQRRSEMISKMLEYPIPKFESVTVKLFHY